MQLDPRTPVYNSDSFTEVEYRSLIKVAQENWKFIGYDDCCCTDASILWRHDIDFSVHRARALAEIEASESVVSTFFVLLHSQFYNVFEQDIYKLIHEIIGMGHHIGLHFDPSFYGQKIRSEIDLIEIMTFEKNILENLYGCKIAACSWHNPSTIDYPSFGAQQIAGMINAYSTDIATKFSYISDSNGLWRERTLKDVLEQHIEQYLHVLTHPEWWTPAAMPPRDKIVRAAVGRKEAALKSYDNFLALHQRPNIGVRKSVDQNRIGTT